MKLSDAIREGAKLHPQAFGIYAAWESVDAVRTCVLGAAYEAVTGKLPPSAVLEGRTIVWAALREACEIAADCTVPEPVSGEPRNVFMIAENLNDVGEWTREAIADYLAEQGL